MNLLYQFIVLILFKYILDVSYTNFVYPMFQYMGFGYNFDALRYFISWVIYFPCMFLLSSNVKTVSDYFFIMVIVFLIAPTLSLYGLDTTLGIETVFYVIVSSVIIKIINYRGVRVFPKIGIPNYSFNLSIIFSIFLVLLVVSNYIVSGVTLNLDPEAVYKFRDENASMADNGIFSYLNGWVYQVVNMYLLVVALYYRKFLYVLLVLSLQVFLFAASAHKTVLFMPILVISTWIILNRTKNSLAFLSLYLLFCTALYCIYIIFDDIVIPSTFLRRAFFVPAQLNFYYIEFFSNNEFVYWSQSILKNFISYPYSQDISSLIGSWVFGDDTRSNNGLVSSGYANMGFAGVLIYSFILGLIIRFIDDLTFGVYPSWFSISITVIPLNVSMIQADLLTSMMTHGLILAVFLLFLSRQNKTTEESN